MEQIADTAAKINMRQVLGAFMVFLSAVCFSSKAVIVKLAYQYHVDTISLLTLRMAFSVPVFVVTGFFSKSNKGAQSGSISSKDYGWLILMGFIGYYLSSLFDFLGLQYISAGLERLILFVYPTLVVLFSYLFLGKPIYPKQYIALGLTYAGVLLVLLGDVHVESRANIIKGGLLVFASAITYASYLMGSGQLIPKFGTVRFTSYAMTLAALGVFMHYLIAGEHNIMALPTPVYWYSFLMAMVATVAPAYLLSEGIRLVGAGNASIIASIGPISTILLAYVFLDERISFIQMMGTLIVLAGILLITLRKN
ncbi:DMT family transporter [Adhaeribacter aquaticus]|uniref:DMT family transporter n=1 Tax=Adhaeribacter aquaticus TaxID=299567 RepID=UPI00047E912B|nr:DMT family transporter [Adhaeribacter aquaticus]